MKFAFAVIAWLGMMSMNAQVTYTERLQRVVESEGRIVLHQDNSITELVNGSVKKSSASPSRKRQIDSTTSQNPDSTGIADTLSTGARVRVNGFRIQVYFGDNSGKAHDEARSAGFRFRNYFSYLPVYVSFVSPHWKCQVGDFRTREEASEVLRQIRSMGIFQEAIIVRSKVNVIM